MGRLGNEGLVTNAQKRPLKKRKRNVQDGIKSADLDFYLSNSPSYLGTASFKSFKGLKIKLSKFSIVFLCRNHWIVFYCTSTSFEIFDPLGFLSIKKCLPESILSFINLHCTMKNIRASHQVQSRTSKLCGLFSIYYILLRDNGYSFKDIMNTFSLNLRKNDKLMLKFINKL